MNFLSLTKPKGFRKGAVSIGSVVATFLLTSLISFNLLAQGTTVTGKVTDTNGGELPGVSIQVKGTTTGTQTGIDGTYRLAGVPANGTLLFSFIGMNTQEIAVANRTLINVTLSDDAQALEEVVVIGYGTQKVRDATGAVATIGAKDFNQGVINSPEQLLQGKLAGVQMTPNSGDPGAGVNFTIRGTSSIRGNNGPLFVVDGVPLDGGDLTNNQSGAGGVGNVASRNPLNFLNPQDIANISVLKDASAAAIYGSRGANGVVLITTKQGRSGPGTFNFSAAGSIATTANRYDLLNSTEMVSELNRGGFNPTGNPLLNGGQNTDWQDQIYRTAYTQNYNMSFGGGTDKTNYFFSLGYQDQQGIVRGSAQDRLQARVNASHKLFNDKVTVGIALTTSKVNDTQAPIGGDIGFEGNLISTSIKTNPTFPVRNADGTFYTTGTPSFRNPTAMLNQVRNFGPVNRTLGNAYVSWKIVDGLTYKLSLAQDNSTSTSNTSVDPGAIGFVNAIQNNQGLAAIGNANRTTSTVEHTLNYVKEFGSHSVDALAGFAYQKFENQGNSVTARLFTAPAGFPLLNNIGFVDATGANKPYDGGSFRNEFDLQSFFGRATYNYNGKYYLTGTLRVDGSSKFGLNNKYGYFPAVNGAWRISEENFLKGSSVISDLKLRAGYGVTGNSEGFPINQSITTYVPNKNAGGINKENVSNPDLQWESTTQYNVGLDFAFLKGRLSGSVDYFYKGTNNLLFPLPAQQPDVAAIQWTNLNANIVNKGVEFMVNYDILSGKKLSWDASVNATFLENVVESLDITTAFTGNVYGQGLSGAFIQPIVVGFPLYGFFLREFQGFDDNGLNVLGPDVPAAQRPYAGSPFPTMTWGLTNNFRYGNWNATVFINGQTGGYLYNNTRLALGGAPAIAQGNNTDRAWIDAEESFSNGLTPSTRFLEKSDFVRLTNLVIGHTVPLGKDNGIKSLNISLAGQNLFLISQYSGLDPEVTNPNAAVNGIPSRGIDYISYPQARVFTLSLNAGF